MTSRKTSRLLALPLITLLLASCSSTPQYQRPDVETPPVWSADATAEAPEIDPTWWRNFSSEELNGLIDLALAENNDLQAGVHRIEQSRAALKASGASLLPSADANGGAGRNYSNPVSGKSRYDTSLRAGAGVSYELDLFGRNRAGVDAAAANLMGAEFTQDALALVVMGDVARGYFNVLNLRNRLSIADENLKIARDILQIVQSRYEAGSESALEVARQKSNLATSEASRNAIAEQVVNAENALAILLARPPQSIAVKGRTLSNLKIPASAAGQPSELLERRPDIRAAEASLISANADIGAARAAFFPSVTLGLDWSIASAGFGDPISTAAALAGALAQPLFSGGRLDAGVELAEARKAELAENYQQAVLIAFREVEDALTAVKATRERESLNAIAMREARTSYTLSRQLYDAGSIDFQDLLDVQRTLLSAEDSYAQSRFERLSASINLYLALGGGWNKP